MKDSSSLKIETIQSKLDNNYPSGLGASKHEDWTENPVLTDGPRKSGTTLMLDLLDGGDELLAYPADFKIKFHYDTLYSPDSCREQYLKNQRHNFESLPDFDYELFKSMLGKGVLSTGLKETILNDLLWVKKCSPLAQIEFKGWCSKEVGGDPKHVISYYRSLFFYGKIILVFREPMRIIRSAILFKRKKGQKVGLWDTLRQAFEAVIIIHKLSQYINEPGVHAITYEEITGDDREKTFASLFTFLGIREFELMYIPTRFKTSVVVGTSTKNTKKIFSNQLSWTKGLKRVDLFSVLVGVFLAKSIIFMVNRKVFSYKRISRKINQKNST